MNINDYILKEIKALTLKDSVQSALNLFRNYPITHFPVLEGDKLLGSFTESDIQTIENKEAKLASYTHLLNSFFVDEKATTLELIKLFADNDTNIIPVVNSDRKYIGYYDVCDVLDVFATSPFLMEESKTLLIEKSINDYSISKVAQIVEANDGKLLGVYISKKTTDYVQITLKIVTDEINEIIQTFRRYDFKIISSHEDDIYLEDLKNRSDYLQKYLEM